jgi:hypothetical protein
LETLASLMLFCNLFYTQRSWQIILPIKIIRNIVKSLIGVFFVKWKKPTILQEATGFIRLQTW